MAYFEKLVLPKEVAMHQYALFGGRFTDRIGGMNSFIYDIADLDELRILMNRLMARKVFDWMHIVDMDILKVIEEWEAKDTSSRALIDLANARPHWDPDTVIGADRSTPGASF